MLKDGFGRKIEYLRVSLTDRCNLRCRYCMPVEGVRKCRHEDILRFEEIERIVRIFSELGVKKFRFTGGEPLVRKGALGFLERLSINNFYLTTNLALPGLDIERLNRVRLSGINVSCDSLRPERYRYITRWGDLDTFLDNFGRLRLPNVKINVVVMKNFNEDEIVDFIHFAVSHNATVRFIEKMDFSSGDIYESPFGGESGFVSLAEIKNRLVEMGIIEGKGLSQGNSVAQYYRLTKFNGKVGFITHISNAFCSRCNRVRIKANGELKLCLFDERNFDLKGLLRSGVSDELVKRWIEERIREKYREPITSVSTETAAEIGG